MEFLKRYSFAILVVGLISGCGMNNDDVVNSDSEFRKLDQKTLCKHGQQDCADKVCQSEFRSIQNSRTSKSNAPDVLIDEPRSIEIPNLFGILSELLN